MGADVKSVRGLARGERAALLISEIQNRNTSPAFGRELSQLATARQIVSRINRLSAACRAAGVPVLVAVHAPRPGYVGMKTNCALLAAMKKDAQMYEGSPMAELHPDLVVEPQDWVFRRRQGLTDFSGTEIDQVLRNLDVETVILAGVSSNVMLLGNTFDVVNRGWTAVVAEDCTAGAPQEHHDYLMRTTYPLLSTVTDSAAIADLLAGRAPALA